ncbi:hypothetical protein [Streptomyces sp. SID14515]|uniref:hypothetical protein n=1 Tax=Streptomyces sp. SID14515 TaxID=2706074 RepID=UPI0013CB6475|nr:hypothetical protein [Streptomyces sp. SID14515]NEB39498.1 hypothetical protein [Streptomyces sp. SID14515]
MTIDESGWDGDQLHGEQRSRYLSIGSVAISDDDAEPIVAEIRNAGHARKMARSLFEEGPRALGPALFDWLLSSTVAFTSHKNRDQQVTVDDFYEVVEEAWARSRRRNVTEALALLRTTREEAVECHQDEHGLDAVLPQALEPLIQAVAAITAIWFPESGQGQHAGRRSESPIRYEPRRHRGGARDRGYPEFRYLSRGVHLDHPL